jgi:hypothetical protein
VQCIISPNYLFALLLKTLYVVTMLSSPHKQSPPSSGRILPRWHWAGAYALLWPLWHDEKYALAEVLENMAWETLWNSMSWTGVDPKVWTSEWEDTWTRSSQSCSNHNRLTHSLQCQRKLEINASHSNSLTWARAVCYNETDSYMYNGEPCHTTVYQT